MLCYSPTISSRTKRALSTLSYSPHNGLHAPRSGAFFLAQEHALNRFFSSASIEYRCGEIINEALATPIKKISAASRLVAIADFGGTNLRVEVIDRLTNRKVTRSLKINGSNGLEGLARIPEGSRLILAGAALGNLIASSSSRLNVSPTTLRDIGIVWSNNFKVTTSSPLVSIGKSEKNEFYAPDLRDGVDIAALLSNGLRREQISSVSIQAVNDTTALAGLHSRAVATLVASTGSNVCLIKNRVPLNLELGEKLIVPSHLLIDGIDIPHGDSSGVMIQALCSGNWMPAIFLNLVSRVTPSAYEKLSGIEEAYKTPLQNKIINLALSKDHSQLNATLGLTAKDAISSREIEMMAPLGMLVAERAGRIAGTMVTLSLKANNYISKALNGDRDTVIIDSSQAEYLPQFRKAMCQTIEHAFDGQVGVMFAPRNEGSAPMLGLKKLMGLTAAYQELADQT